MARELITQLVNSEDIVSYECNFISKFIRILVGVGITDSLGNFIVQPEQTYNSYLITGQEYENIIAHNEAKLDVIKKDDLWAAIDQKRLEEIEQKRATLNMPSPDPKPVSI